MDILGFAIFVAILYSLILVTTEPNYQNNTTKEDNNDPGNT